MIARGAVIVSACLALLGLIVAVFATLSRPHVVAICRAHSAQDPFAFDLRHQLVDAEIGLGAFVRGYIAGGAVTVSAISCCGCCNAERLQLRHVDKNFVIMRGGVHGQCLHHDGDTGGCGRQGAEVAIKLFHEGGRGACDLDPGCSRRGVGCDIVD